MFGEDYTFSYNLLEVYKARHSRWEDEERDEDSWFRNYGSSHVPSITGEYFTDATKGLERQKFGTDDMLQVVNWLPLFVQTTYHRLVLQEAFQEATEKKVVEFTLKDELPVR
jgi:hypothetical protein